MARVGTSREIEPLAEKSRHFEHLRPIQRVPDIYIRHKASFSNIHAQFRHAVSFSPRYNMAVLLW